MATTLCATKPPASLTFAPRKDAPSKPRPTHLTAKRHKRPGPHIGHGGHATDSKPQAPDSFTAPFSAKTAQPPTEGQLAMQTEARAEGTQLLMEEKKNCWRENLKGQIFWVLRALATAID